MSPEILSTCSILLGHMSVACLALKWQSHLESAPACKQVVKGAFAFSPVRVAEQQRQALEQCYL